MDQHGLVERSQRGDRQAFVGQNGPLLGQKIPERLGREHRIESRLRACSQRPEQCGFDVGVDGGADPRFPLWAERLDIEGTEGSIRARPVTRVR